jgi:Spy/CpxP family protein refolding chaperone
MIRVFLLSCVLLTAFVPPLLAQESYREFEKGLNLSEPQKAQVQAIKRRYVDEWRALRVESARKRFQLRELESYEPDQKEKAERVQKELDQIEFSKQELFREYRMEVSTVLNEEQRDRFNRFMDWESRRLLCLPRHRLDER